MIWSWTLLQVKYFYWRDLRFLHLVISWVIGGLCLLFSLFCPYEQRGFLFVQSRPLFHSFLICFVWNWLLRLFWGVWCCLLATLTSSLLQLKVHLDLRWFAKLLVSMNLHYLILVWSLWAQNHSASTLLVALEPFGRYGRSCGLELHVFQSHSSWARFVRSFWCRERS